MKKLFLVVFIFVFLTGCKSNIETCNEWIPLTGRTLKGNKNVMRKLGITFDKNINGADSYDRIDRYCWNLKNTGRG